MASSKEYLAFVLDQLSALEDVTFRPMMGEYILYYKGRIFGGVYDDRVLVKPVAAAKAYMPDAPWESPYEGAREMILVERTDERDYFAGLVDAMYDELPEPKPGKGKR